MMPQPATRSNLQICDGLRSCTTTHDGCLPDFEGWSGYPLIGAMAINPGIDVMGHELPSPAR
jgi:hypothetical protein